jgi:ATP-binding cassette subfamily B protein
MKLYFNWFNKYIIHNKSFRNKLLWILLISLIISAISYISPLISRQIIDGLGMGKGISFINRLGLLLLTIAVLSSTIAFFKIYIENVFINYLTLNLRLDLFKQLQKLSWKFFEKNKVGEIYFKLLNDSNIICTNGIRLFLNLLLSIVSFTVINVIIFKTNYKISIFINIILVFNTAFYYLFQKKIEGYSRSVQEVGEKTSGVVQV